MAVEYLYDAIRAIAGQEIVITAVITDDEEDYISEACCLMLHDEDGEAIIAMGEGEFIPQQLSWEFTIPAEATRGLKGRYWYCIMHENNNLCFKQPIYLK